MLQLIIYTALHLAVCMLFFGGIQRPVFILYNLRANPQRLTAHDVWDIYRHGYKTDMAVAAYLTAVPWLLGWVHALVPRADMTVPLMVYEGVAAIIVALICVADTALYRFWRSKIDSSVMVYLRNLKGAFASVTAGYIVVATVAVAAVAVIYAALTISVIYCSGISLTGSVHWHWWHYALVTVEGILIAGVLFAMIRGLASRPNSPSIAYYCKNMYYNHAAINPVYNFIYSLSIRDEYRDRYHFLPDDECRRIVKEMFPTEGTTQLQLLNTSRPNIVLVIWESLCADYVEAIGGKADVTNNITRLSREGVLFTGVRAGSFRTDRGIVCLLSGIPGQPTTSLVKYTKKLPGLPAITHALKAEGYTTTVIHGGDLSVLHKSDYYAAIGNDRMIGQKDIADSQAPTCRWGIHDDYMFDYLYDDIINVESRQQPWMVTLQTLSSHEPFIVPYHRLDHNISNAYAFTDEAFGRFVERIRQTDQWRNLLIIVVGDHGMNNNDVPLSHYSYSHIPILMIGGAVKAPAVIDTCMGQTDLAATLLGQLGLSHTDFEYSRDVLSDTYVSPSAFHAYTGGFVFADETGYTDYDLVSGTAIEGEDSDRERKGKAILQYLYADLARR